MLGSGQEAVGGLSSFGKLGSISVIVGNRLQLRVLFQQLIMSVPCTRVHGPVVKSKLAHTTF